jgi:UDP-N-acetylmuramate dehydrogenase
MQNIAKEAFYEIRGTLEEQAPLGEAGWFRCGGRAQLLFKPADEEDLSCFLEQLPKGTPVNVFGMLSNTIIRDGGLPGVTVRLGKGFAQIEEEDGFIVRAGAMALDSSVAQFACREAIAGLAFFCGIPGTVGGAVKMNAGCYGSETIDVLQEARVLYRNGTIHELGADQLGLSYRHSNLPDEAIVLGARFKGSQGTSEEIRSHMQQIKERRNQTQPLRERTGGSTFANPDADELERAGLPAGTKVWQLIERANCRGLQIGGAQMSEKHCNFMINTGKACAEDLESLGEEVRRRVFEQTGIKLRWEIKRVGERIDV